MRHNRVFVDAERILSGESKINDIVRACAPTKAYAFVYNEGAFYESKKALEKYEAFMELMRLEGCLALPAVIAKHEDFPAIIFTCKDIIAGKVTPEDITYEAKKSHCGVVIVGYDDSAWSITDTTNIVDLIEKCARKRIDLEIADII